MGMEKGSTDNGTRDTKNVSKNGSLGELADAPFLQKQEADVYVRGTEKSFWKLWKDKCYRGKLLHSFFLSCGLLCVMMIEAQPGSTLIDFQIITNSDFEAASRFFTVHTVGFMTGSVLIGFLSKKVNADALMVSALFAMGACAIASPLCSPYYLMMAIRFVSGMFPGILETVVYSEQMRTWAHEGKGVTQLVMFLSSLGLFVSPVVSEPFIAAKLNLTDSGSGENLSLRGGIDTNSSIFENDLNSTSTLPMDTSNEEDFRRLYTSTNVFYAYLITGGLTVVTSIVYLIYSLKRKHQIETHLTPGNTASHDSEKKYRQLPVVLRISMTFGVSFFYMFYAILNTSGNSFLMSFLVNQYDFISTSQSAYILTLYLNCGLVSRLGLVFVADRFKAFHLLFSFVVFVIVSFVAFTVAALYGQIVVLIIATGAMSIGLAPVFALVLSWSQADFLQITSRESSCLMFASACGVTINPLILPYLMEEKDNMWFCYLLTIWTFVPFVVLIILLLVNKCYVNRKYGPLYAIVQEIEYQVVSEN